jgi:hypothetical protein
MHSSSGITRALTVTNLLFSFFTAGLLTIRPVWIKPNNANIPGIKGSNKFTMLGGETVTYHQAGYFEMHWILALECLLNN